MNSTTINDSTINNDPTKRYIAITGASSGIGYATACAFAKRGKNLIIIARREAQLQQLKQQIKHISPQAEVIIKVTDLARVGSAQILFNELNCYFIEAWVNNAGFGHYGQVKAQDLTKIADMLQLNIEALTILSSLYVKKYHDQPATQLINISSRGGYTIVPNAVTYCATKFYVNAFTEGLAHELKAANAQLKAKVLAPAATQTEFGQVANDTTEYDYQQRFAQYHTASEMADFLLALYDSQYSVGEVNATDFSFSLQESVLAYSGHSLNNQR